MQHRPLLYGVLFAMASAFAYGMNTPFAPAVFAGGGTAILVILLRALGAVILSALCLPFFNKTDYRHTRTLPVCALLAVFLFAQGWLYVSSVAFIPVSLAALLFFTWPVLVGTVAICRRQSGIPLSQLLYFVVALGGLGLALGADFHTLDARGIAFACCGAVCMAIYVLATSRCLPAEANPVLLNMQINAVIVVIALIVMLLLEDFSLPTGADALRSLTIMIVFYAFATCAQIIAIRHAGAPLAALFFNLEPVVSILLAALLLAETLSYQQYIGGSIVIIALILYSAHRCFRPAVIK